MLQTLVIATRNPGKLEEFRAVLQPFVQNILSLNQASVPPEFEPAEDAESFAEIVTAKAQAYAAFTKLPTLADDSGLMIDALHGQPGVHSKRFFEGSDAERNHHVLSLLKNFPNAEQRGAHFICEICLYFPQTDETQLFEGRVDGVVAPAARGRHGFGYDPIFIPEGRSKTFAELGPAIKNTLSHRARALEALLSFAAKI